MRTEIDTTDMAMLKLISPDAGTITSSMRKFHSILTQKIGARNSTKIDWRVKNSIKKNNPST